MDQDRAICRQWSSKRKMASTALGYLVRASVLVLLAGTSVACSDMASSNGGVTETAMTVSASFFNDYTATLRSIVPAQAGCREDDPGKRASCSIRSSLSELLVVYEGGPSPVIKVTMRQPPTDYAGVALVRYFFDAAPLLGTTADRIEDCVNESIDNRGNPQSFTENGYNYMCYGTVSAYTSEMGFIVRQSTAF